MSIWKICVAGTFIRAVQRSCRFTVQWPISFYRAGNKDPTAHLFLSCWFIQLLSSRSLFLVVIIISLKRVLQLAGDFLEEANLLAQVVLHLQAEVPYTCAVKVLDLGQRCTGNDVAAVVEFSLLL